MRRFDIAQVPTGGIMVDSPEDGDYVLHDDVALVVGALENFVKQWNACGPNSDFGRYFGATYMQACQALATLNSVPCEDCNGRGNTGETIYSSDPFQPPEAEQCGTCYGTGRISLKD